MEKWMQIRGFAGRYEVSDQGRVRSISRVIWKADRCGNLTAFRWKGRILAQHTWGAQYPGVVLVDEAGVKTRKMLHRLVAEAFLPNPLNLRYVNHIDGDKGNAAAANLEWCSQAENVAHAYLTGAMKTGKAHHFARLSRDARGRCLAAGGDRG